MSSDFLIVNANVTTCVEALGDPLGTIRDGAVHVQAGKIAYVGSAANAPTSQHLVDARGGIVMPGLIDPHTHLIFAGSRVEEFARKMAGEDYRAIAAAGGGIASTVRATRAASDEELFLRARARALAMRAHGVTSIEVKSGYGLTREDELRSLRVARRIAREHIVRVTTSFLGAHVVPPERREDRDGYVREILDEMLPAVVAERLADACDVYCDEGAFTLDETRAILGRARELGLRTRAHVGQFVDLGGPELLAEFLSLSADHLEAVSDAGLVAMAAAGVVAVLLPGAWCTLRQTPPDTARMRRTGVRIAIGTDCNPGTSPCTDLPLCAALAVRQAGISLEEAILGITTNAAKAAGIATGTITIGGVADLAIFPYSDPRAIPYSLGGSLASHVFLGGNLVHRGGESETVLW